MNKKKNEWLSEVIQAGLSGDSLNWFEAKIMPLAPDEIAKKITLLFSTAARHIPGTIPQLSAQQQQEAEHFYPGYSKDPLTLQQLCRLLLMLQLPADQNNALLRLIFETGDINELIILYKGLYWLDNAPEFAPRIAEGIRTNMAVVFDAIALSNPFPAKYLQEDAWNQMVLKAVFMGRPLYRIYKLTERRNQKLALILHDYIHERWSAGRQVSPEVWQLMPGFITDAILKDLRKAAQSADSLESEAAAKAIAENEHKSGHSGISWQEIGKQHSKKTT